MARNAVSRTGTPIVADTRQLARLARNLRAASPEAWKACRRELRVAVAPVAADAAARASAFSSTVPSSVRVRVTGGGNVKIVAGGKRAPVGAPMENKGIPGKFRHPLWGSWEPPSRGFKNHGKQWVDGDPRNQMAHPYLNPAAEAGKGAVADKVLDAVTSAVERVLRDSL